jgi:4'-phosphopantetheinyl transferase
LIDPARVTVHVTAIEDAATRERLPEYLRLLDPAERERHERMQLAATRRQFLVGRALIRHALSLRAPAPPGGWPIAIGPAGKPELAPAAGHLRQRLRFNLSHSDEMVACAVAEETDVGIDVERIVPARADRRLAEELFSPVERAALDALPPSQRPARFFAYWTLKEAYLKARGIGLAAPLATLSFSITPGAPIAVRFEDPRDADDDPACWRFEQTSLGDYVLSVAVAAGKLNLPLPVERCVP